MSTRTLIRAVLSIRSLRNLWSVNPRSLSFDQYDDRKFNISRSGQIFGQYTWDGAVAERPRGWQVEGRVSLSSLNNPPPGSTVGFQIALRDYTYTGLVDAWPQGSDPSRPDTWGDLVLKEESEVPSAHDRPPTVSITVSPKMVRLGETFKVLLKAEDDVELQSMWWWGDDTGVPELDKAHTAEVSGKSSASSWTATASKEGTFTLLANARDSSYPTPGEAHQASEGAGLARATITVVSMEALGSLKGEVIALEKLDGVIGDEWKDGARMLLSVPDGEMEVLIKHDNEYLYLAFNIDDATKESQDEIQLYLDTLHNEGKSFNQPDDRHFGMRRDGLKLGKDTWEAAVAERPRGWQLEARVSLSDLNNPRSGTTLGVRIYHRDMSKGLTFWPHGSYYPDTWGDLQME